MYLQKKLPLDNKMLRSFSCIDPAIHGHHIAQEHLKKLPKYLPKLVSVEEQDSFELEVRRYNYIYLIFFCKFIDPIS